MDFITKSLKVRGKFHVFSYYQHLISFFYHRRFKNLFISSCNFSPETICSHRAFFFQFHLHTIFFLKNIESILWISLVFYNSLVSVISEVKLDYWAFLLSVVLLSTWWLLPLVIAKGQNCRKLSTLNVIYLVMKSAISQRGKLKRKGAKFLKKGESAVTF